MAGISVSKICIPFSGITEDPAIAIIEDGNTVAWYDYTDATTLTDDGGGLISSWRDKLLSGNDLTAAGTQRPTITANGILFNGTTNRLRSGVIAAMVQPEMIYIVFRNVTWSDVRGILDGLAGLQMGFLQQGVTPNMRLNLGVGVVNNADLPVNTFGIARIAINGASSKIQVNANAAATGNVGVGDAGGITVGSYGTGAHYFSNIEVKELIFRHVVDAAADETAIYNYLKSKHGL